jgi:hypothetical protein
MPKPRSRVPYRTLVAGFEAARARFSLAASSENRDDAVIHYGADALIQADFIMPSVYGGAPFGAAPFGGGYPVSAWIWKPRRSLPHGMSSAGKAEYDALIAGKLVTVTLEAAYAEPRPRLRP